MNYVSAASFVHTIHELYIHKLHRWFTWRHAFSDGHFLNESFQLWLTWKYVFSSNDILCQKLPDVKVITTVADSDPSNKISLTFMDTNENVYTLLMMINTGILFMYDR